MSLETPYLISEPSSLSLPQTAYSQFKSPSAGSLHHAGEDQGKGGAKLSRVEEFSRFVFDQHIELRPLIRGQCSDAGAEE